MCPSYSAASIYKLIIKKLILNFIIIIIVDDVLAQKPFWTECCATMIIIMKLQINFVN